MSYPLGIGPHELIERLHAEMQLHPTTSDTLVILTLGALGFKDYGYQRRCLEAHNVIRHEYLTGDPF